MARIRTVKPEFLNDEKLSTISRDARLTFIGFWIHSDDYGVIKGHATWLKSQIFPYDDIKPPLFAEWVKELCAIGVICPFSKNGESFYYIRHFPSHQKVDRPSQWRNPEPPENISDALVEPSSSPQEPLVAVSSKVSSKVKGKYGEAVMLTNEEFNKLISKYGEATTRRAIEILDQYVMSKGKKYASHYHTILNGWPIEKAEQQGAQNNQGRVAIL